ncbi:MAG: YaiO family outer membrane beta-barrel protein [Gammaproteobacteria bacterium]
MAAAMVLASSVATHAEPPTGSLELNGLHYQLSDGFAPTSGVNVRGRLGPIGNDEWLAEVAWLDRFDDNGTYGQVGNIHQFGERWFTQLYLGGSSGGFFWPELRVDASVSHRLLAQRNLVVTAGVAHFDAKDIHSDTGYRLEASYYTPSPWVLQGGVTYNISEPGGVGSTSGYGALSHVRGGSHIVTLRVGAGHQAYQPLRADSFQVDIPFTSVRVTWKQWVGTHWGVQLAADSYLSDVYDQHGVEFGLFQEF